MPLERVNDDNRVEGWG